MLVFKRVPFSLSCTTISEISNSFNGNGICLLALIVFKSPGSKVVLTTCEKDHTTG